MIYLYVKQHNKTKLKYFGKTTRNDPYRYNGSGTYWKRHLKIHGKDIITLNVWNFENQEECEKFAIKFSLDNNIVESSDWANLRLENGKDGVCKGNRGMSGTSNPMYGRNKDLNPFYGKKHSAETIKLYKKQKAGSNNPRAKKITTPIGQFSTVKEGAEKLKIRLVVLRNRLNEGVDGYHWGWF